ncbi:3-keto-5-aminohexanoate cleavage protein [Bosea sp. (in: a-proteobacteria)]|uniref:3-keto-5-aminohexanoate cleavage protein n=1 Tax=Bosea sp. (in: a-proteobacteria) TaxID=1871050 RepID=UPI0025BD6F52|nr:3-keto-5-aminohexanoate cleavage protein [Bosea sp. (in: a-proteobacteria)]MBR3192770.1 3-keto-5-aminohexanoate cleavage protein [Bosea sp. (in: a-proteobacteria)]
MRAPLPKVFITCAITGNLTKPEQSPHLPITPQQIAEAALEAAEAGAAIAHIHVRDPGTGRPSMELSLYEEVVARIRAGNPELIINLTTGPGGRFVPSEQDPKIAGPGTTLMVPEERVAHVGALRPDICTLDLNTMNSGGEVVINTPANVRRMAKVITEAGVRPEIELFDSGDIALLNDLIKDGTLQPKPLTSFVMGVRYGFQPSPETVLYARGLLPEGALFTAIGIGRSAFQSVALSYLAGGHIRVGLEDGVFIDHGVLAPSNAALVKKARRIVEDLGGAVATPQEARALIGLPVYAPAAKHVA